MKYKIMFMALLAMCACAFLVSQADDSDAAVVASGTCGTNLNWEYDDATHILTISGSGTVMDDMLENRPWENYINDIYKVVIPSSAKLTNIGAGAFKDCINLTQVAQAPSQIGTSFISSLVKFGDSAFLNCSSFTYPSAQSFKATTIGKSAFENTAIELGLVGEVGASLTIGDRAFAECTHLKSNFKVYSTTSTLGVDIFQGSSVTKLYWLAGVNFVNHTGNDSEIIHGNTGSAGTNISWEYLIDTTTLTFTGTGKVLEQTRYTSNLGSEYIRLASAECTNIVFNTPNLTTIGDYAFSTYTSISSTQWSKVQNMEIPTSVIKIGDYGFYYFKGNIPYMPNLQSCGVLAFTQSSLNWPALPDSLNSIGARAFESTTVSSVVIHDGITLGTNAFKYNICTQIIYDANITSTYGVSYSPFYGCSYVTDITIGDSVRSIPVNMFTYSTTGTKSTPTTINWNATNCSDFATGNSCFLRYNVNTIIFGDNVQHIPAYLCEDMKSTLESVSFNDGLESIGDSAFANCTSMVVLSLPDSLKSIGVWGFSNCPNLLIRTLPVGMESISTNAFSNCTGITQMYIPVGFDANISDGAFAGCTNLAKILNLSELDIQLGSEDNGHIAYYADEVRDNIGSTAIVQQKQNVVHEVIEKSDAASKLLRVLPALMAIAVISFLCGLFYYRETERNKI